jgi:hypothetical protein
LAGLVPAHLGQRLKPAFQPLAGLPEFDDFEFGLAARFAFERTLIVISLVRFDAGKPHRRAACRAVGMLDFLL